MMKSLAKRIGTALGLFFLCSVFILSFPIKVYAWEAHLNEEGNIEIYTVDKKRSTARWYFTESVTLTRCAYNPTTQNIHSSNEYVGAPLGNLKEELVGKTFFNTWTITIDLNKHPGFDMETYMEAANGGLGIQEDDPVFEKSGYLIVNFNIRTYKNGKGHLRYEGGAAGGNMWEIEGFNTAPLAGDATPITSYEQGDVVVIDLEKSVKDKYSPGIFGVN